MGGGESCQHCCRHWPADPFQTTRLTQPLPPKYATRHGTLSTLMPSIARFSSVSVGTDLSVHSNKVQRSLALYLVCIVCLFRCGCFFVWYVRLFTYASCSFISFPSLFPACFFVLFVCFFHFCFSIEYFCLSVGRKRKCMCIYLSVICLLCEFLAG